VRLTNSFMVTRTRDEVVEILCSDETLLGLVPHGHTEIIASAGDLRTTETRYRALGRVGVATFHFSFLLDGDVRFEKVCDGNVWKWLEGRVSVEERGTERCDVRIEISGRTKSLVPEFTIKAPMEEQIQEMKSALKVRLNSRITRY
jgi:hypothetical protein